MLSTTDRIEVPKDISDMLERLCEDEEWELARKVARAEDERRQFSVVN